MKKIIVLLLLALFLAPFPAGAVSLIGSGVTASASPPSSSHWPDDPAGAEYIYVDTDGVSGDFSSLSAAEAAIGTTGYCENWGTKPCVIVCSASTGVADTTAVEINLSTDPTASTPLIIRATDPDHLYPMAVTGDETVNVKEDYVTVRGLSISGDSSYNAIDVYEYRAHVTIDSCVIDGAKNGIYGESGGADYSGNVVTNNILYGCYVTGISFPSNYAFTYENKVINNTVYNCNTSDGTYSAGIYWHPSATNITVMNNISVENNQKDFYDADSTIQSYNISSDATAAGTGSLTNKTLADIDFVSTTAGSEDLHIQSTSCAINAGTDPTGTITWDIDGDERTSSGVEIGADQND